MTRACSAPLLLIPMRGVVLSYNGTRYALCPRTGCASVFVLNADSATASGSIMCAGCHSDAARVLAALSSYPLERCAVCNYCCASMRLFWVRVEKYGRSGMQVVVTRV